jgi:hypothetical protein
MSGLWARVRVSVRMSGVSTVYALYGVHVSWPAHMPKPNQYLALQSGSLFWKSSSLHLRFYAVRKHMQVFSRSLHTQRQAGHCSPFTTLQMADEGEAGKA